jgi:hypothetical protein
LMRRRAPDWASITLTVAYMCRIETAVQPELGSDRVAPQEGENRSYQDQVQAMSDPVIDEIEKDFLAECRDDYVGLWSLVRRFRDRRFEESRVVDAAMLILKRLLEAKQIVSGTFIGTEFKVTDIPVSRLIAKIRQDWAKLGRDPQIGEIVWFASPSVEKG